MADDMTEAEQQMARQEQWGMSLADLAVLRLVRMIKLARGRLVELEARVKALEDATK